MSARLSAAPSRFKAQMRPQSFVPGFMLLALVSAHAQSPEVSRILPFSARPGETISLTLQGKDLLQPKRIWTSFGSETKWAEPPLDKSGQPLKPDGRKLTAQLTLAKDAPLGVGFLRLPTATGLSGPMLFLVDDLPVVARESANASLEKAQSLTLPTAVEGHTDSGRSDFFKVSLKAGEAVSAETYGLRIGSKLDPLLRLLDASGKELARSDDTPGLAGDCRLRYVAKVDVTLFIELRDASFGGSDDHFYHLRLGDFPSVSAVFPPLAQRGSTIEVNAVGDSATGVAPTKVNVPASQSGAIPLTLRFAPEKPAGIASIHVVDKPVVVEGDASLKVNPPAVFVGRLENVGEKDAFQIDAKKDERITLTPITRDLGSSAMLYLAVHDDAGAFITENDLGPNSPSSDAPASFKAPRNGVFKVSIEDLAHRGGADFVYGIQVERESQNGFELSTSPGPFIAPSGGSFTTKVTAQRRGINAPITLELLSGSSEPLPPEIRCQQNIIEKGKNDTTLKITVPGNVPPGSLYHLRVRGNATEGEQTYTATATLPKPDPNKAGKEPVMAAILSMPRPPRLLTQSFPVCVGPEAPDFFRIELTTPVVFLPTIVGKSSFVLRQTALTESFDDNARLTFRGLPEGVSIRNENGRGGRIKGQIDFICEVSGPPTLNPGTHSFEIIANAEFKGVQKEVKLAKVPLKVVAPLGISATLEGPLNPGKKQRLKILATRFEETNPQPIQVRLAHFPAGISANNTVTIPAAESSAILELSSGQETLVGKTNSLTLTATTRVLGQEVTVDSIPIELEVQQ